MSYMLTWEEARLGERSQKARIIFATIDECKEYIAERMKTHFVLNACVYDTYEYAERKAKDML